MWTITDEDTDSVQDHSAVNNDCTIAGGFQFVDDPERGIVGSFDGTGRLATNAFVVELGNGDFSIAAWIKTDGVIGIPV